MCVCVCVCVSSINLLIFVMETWCFLYDRHTGPFEHITFCYILAVAEPDACTGVQSNSDIILLAPTGSRSDLESILCFFPYLRQYESASVYDSRFASFRCRRRPHLSEHSRLRRRCNTGALLSRKNEVKGQSKSKHN